MSQHDSDRDRDGAGAGSDVGDADRWRPDRARRSAKHVSQLGEGEIHQLLRLRARHQRPGVHGKGDAVELLDAADVGHRLANRAPFERRCVARGRAVTRETLGMCQQPGPIGAERIRQEQLRVQPGAGRAGRTEAVDARSEKPADRRGRPARQDPPSPSSASEASRSAWSVALSASSNRSRLPSSTPGRFERSIPMR